MIIYETNIFLHLSGLWKKATPGLIERIDYIKPFFLLYSSKFNERRLVLELFMLEREFGKPFEFPLDSPDKNPFEKEAWLDIVEGLLFDMLKLRLSKSIFISKL